MTSVGEDFPRQQERVRKLREIYLTLPGGVGSFGAVHLDQVLGRAAEAQSSGDLLRILRSYHELTGCRE